MLLQVPKGLGGAKIRAAGISAAITGTTIMMEYVAGKHIKVLVLEGSLGLSVNGTMAEPVTLHPGEMVVMPPNAKRITDPVHVDIAAVMRTSSLVNMGGIGSQLPSAGLIAAEIEAQDRANADNFVATNMTIADTGVALVSPRDTADPILLARGGIPELARHDVTPPVAALPPGLRALVDMPASSPAPAPSHSPDSTPPPAPSATPVSTPVPEPSATPASTPTSEPTSTPVATPPPAPSATPMSTPTPAPAPSATPISTPTPGPSATPVSTPTPAPSATPISTPTPAPSATPVSTPTPGPSPTPVSTPTPAPSATPNPAPSPQASPAPTAGPTASPNPTPSPSPENEDDDHHKKKPHGARYRSPRDSGRLSGGHHGIHALRQPGVARGTIRVGNSDEVAAMLEKGPSISTNNNPGGRAQRAGIRHFPRPNPSKTLPLQARAPEATAPKVEPAEGQGQSRVHRR